MRLSEDRGFSLLELLIVVAGTATLAAIAVPGMLTMLDNMKLDGTARDVHSEIQAARLRAVSTNTPMRIRFNCPAAGDYRIVELIGTPGVPDPRDSAADRCSLATYPFPVADSNPLARPKNDGPVRHLRRDTSFTSAQTIEFWPDGSAHAASATGGTPWPAIPDRVTVSITWKSYTKSIEVNGVGKIKTQ